MMRSAAADQIVGTVQNATGTADVAPDSTTGTVMATDRGLVTVPPGQR
ncbi:hypothetical protein [Streptomyces sp. NPDC041003]